MRLDFDSSAFFFVDANCANGCTANRRGYESQKSSSFKEPSPRQPYQWDYLGAKQTGRMVQDIFTFVGLPIPMPLVDQPAGQLVSAYGDGVAGLGFPDPKSPYPSLALLTQKVGKQMFAFHVDSMNYTRANGFRSTGYGTLADNDEKNCQSKIYYHNLAQSNKWSLQLKTASFHWAQLTPGEAVIRPGPYKILGPQRDMLYIKRIVGARYDNGEYYVPCNRLPHLPAFAFKIDDIEHSLYADSYTVTDLDDPSKCRLLFGVKPASMGSEPWVFGDAVFRRHCLIFDIAQGKFGFTFRK